MSEEKKSAFIFPAFAHEYPDDPFGGFEDFGHIFQLFLKQASKDVDEDLINFNSVSNNFLEDEIRTQYITYIYSCSLSEYFKEKGVLSCANPKMRKSISDPSTMLATISNLK